MSSVIDYMSRTGQVYQAAAIISDKALFQVCEGQGQSYSQFEYDPRRETAPRRQCYSQLIRGQTPPLLVNHRHVTGQDTMSCQEVSNQERHLHFPSDFPHPIKYMINILPVTPNTIKLTDIGYIRSEPPLL